MFYRFIIDIIDVLSMGDRFIMMYYQLLHYIITKCVFEQSIVIHGFTLKLECVLSRNLVVV